MDQGLFLKNNMDYGSAAEVPAEALTVGQRLSQARRASGEIDMEKISDELCIRIHLLRALEQDDFDKFPSACYAAGFLKNYASYLKLDVGQITAQYKKEFQGSMKKVKLVFLEVEKDHNSAQHMIVSLAILSALVLYGVWYFSGGNDRLLLSALPDVSEVTSNILVSAILEDEQNPVMAEVTAAPAPKEALEKNQGFYLVQRVNATPLEATTKNTALGTGQIRLSMREDAWIRIIDANKKILLDRILLAGEEFYMTNRKGMTMMTSNAGAVSLFVGDMAISLFGDSGQIRENISLDKQDLLMTTAHLSP
ncbi:MAG: hypothetical protein COB49_00305 [Alphaproteobacteria bacterium]|nr:MAG: hypothetical protein COB49_00305 [Alphaproteobacteria bacterium]